MKPCNSCFFLILSLFLLGSCEINERENLQHASELFSSEKYEEALIPLSSILQQNNKNDKARLLRAKCYSLLQLKEKMKIDLWTLVNSPSTTCPEKIDAANDLYNYHDYYLANDSCLKYCFMMREWVDNCKNEGPSKQFLMEMISTIYGRKENYRKALAYADSIVIYGGEIEDRAESKAWTYRLQNIPKQAIEEYSIAIDHSTNPQSQKWYFTSRAEMHQLTGNLDSACADWQKALNLGNTRAQAKLDSFCIK